MVSKKWNRGHVLDNSEAMLIWDFEFNLPKKTTSRRPDLMLEEKQMKTIQICDVACPQENNIEKNRLKKRTNYRQLVFEIERRRGFKNKVMLLAISAIGGGIKEVLIELENMFIKMICVKRLWQKCRKLFIWRVRVLFRKWSGLVQSY